MPVTEGKQRVMVTLTDEELLWVDTMAARFRMTRSQVLSKCVGDSREILEMCEMLGAKPERIAKVIDFFYGLWNATTRKVEVKGDKVQLR